MKFTEAVRTCFQKYVTFSGRARRSEYWFFTLFIYLAEVILVAAFDDESAIVSLLTIATFLPGLAVAVRRLHDVGRRGSAILISLIPLVGAVLLIVWLAQDSQPGSNIYGPNPKSGRNAAYTAYKSPQTAQTTTAYTPPRPVGTKSTTVYTPPKPAEPKEPAEDPVPEVPDGKRCPDCGNAVPEDAKFCPLCGERLF